MKFSCGLSLIFLVACGAKTGARPATLPTVTYERQIISLDTDGTERELFSRGEHALAEQRWSDARLAFETLLRASPSAKLVAPSLFNLGLAYEGLEERPKARETFQRVVKEFGTHALVRPSLVRLLGVHSYLEEWPELGQVAGLLLEGSDLDPVDRLTALGARGLSRVERGDEERAMRDVQSGLDLVDDLQYGKTGRLPSPAAQLYFALGEIRRVRSERLQLGPSSNGTVADPVDFLPRMEARCQGLLDAQSAFADAMRSVDPHWIAMSGFRVGEMYRTLHRDLMALPPTRRAKTESDRQLFFAMMHVRYRVLLEKGFEMMKRTLVLKQKHLDESAWVRRAEATEREIEFAIEQEKAILKTLPYSEETVELALEKMRKKAAQEAERKQKQTFDKMERDSKKGS